MMCSQPSPIRLIRWKRVEELRESYWGNNKKNCSLESLIYAVIVSHLFGQNWFERKNRGRDTSNKICYGYPVCPPFRQTQQCYIVYVLAAKYIDKVKLCIEGVISDPHSELLSWFEASHPYFITKTLNHANFLAHLHTGNLTLLQVPYCISWSCKHNFCPDFHPSGVEFITNMFTGTHGASAHDPPPTTPAWQWAVVRLITAQLCVGSHPFFRGGRAYYTIVPLWPPLEVSYPD